MLELLGSVLVTAGVFFFFAGAVGLLRFPDIYTRLHAVNKADNTGLGLIVAGLILHSGTAGEAVLLVLVWVMVLISSAAGSHLIARSARRRGVRQWTRPS